MYVAGEDGGSNDAVLLHIYYYWIAKYFDNDIYDNRGTRWLCANGVLRNSSDGIIGKDTLTEEDAAMLIHNNLVVKSGGDYKLNFACFSKEQFAEFISLFEINNARLDNQINQWVSVYLFQIVGYVTDELIRRGTLRKPDWNKPLTDGVFCVEGAYIDP